MLCRTTSTFGVETCLANTCRFILHRGSGLLGVVVSFARRTSVGFKSLELHQFRDCYELEVRYMLGYRLHLSAGDHSVDLLS